MPLFSRCINTFTLDSTPYQPQIQGIINAALNAADPSDAVLRVMKREGDKLEIKKKLYSLNDIERIFLIGIGKAALPMTLAAHEILSDQHITSIVITKEIHTKTKRPDITVLEAGHPIPDVRSIAAAQQVKELLSNTTPNDLVIFCISGGGSALLTLPVNGVSLMDLQKITTELLACGATIEEINTLRKHLDQIKGGQLAGFASPAQVVTLILSDVVGDPLDRIASGPTVADPSTYQDSLQILKKYDIIDRIPAAIHNHLIKGVNQDIPETPKTGNRIFEKVENILVGNNILAAQAARSKAEEEGFHSLYLSSFIQGEAREAGRFFAAIARQAAILDTPVPRPACIIAGGETTVTLRGNGLGGRNQELALAAVHGLAGLRKILLLSFATDGEDGPTNAAGAVVSGDTLERAEKMNLDPDGFLVRNDSYHFFDSLGDLLRLGPTQTNVNDITLIFTY